ncbi:3-hydroxyacyl-ACP dehydratase FabZ [Thermovirga sp.]|uniref:3-hydroxyacyl-ACP dehydratase FabZ n=1 Tax=Thermovirga sp. TaxID=2699834 RepID=UPI0025E3C5A1|nr:3-hydroxyacyl-ACP dehydratase FabZ [Thermovirga sp.]MBO8154137.1 3-hydroxyacyl-ACP dehydratase FabZ [Thermovirga sp.]MCD6183377.1 3-hydroxyacyl-ACP dehydratase FabZ [Thermovirga sp.]
MDIQKIRSFLPHRYPFLLVDRVLEVSDDRVVGYKNVTINEPFFMGHFPEEPVMPGVLVLESMGQVAAMMIASKPEAKGLAMYLTGIEKAKLRRPVVPGDQLVTEAKLVKLRGKVGKVEAVAKVEGEVVAEAMFSFVVAERLTGEKD